MRPPYSGLVQLPLSVAKKGNVIPHAINIAVSPGYPCFSETLKTRPITSNTGFRPTIILSIAISALKTSRKQ